MNKKFLRLGIILALISVVFALILSGTPRRSKAASINLENNQYVRDSWIYGFTTDSGTPRTDGDYSSSIARFEAITDITNYDVNVNANATVRMDTSISNVNTFNGLTLKNGATLTHTSMGANKSFLPSALLGEGAGYVDERNHFAVRWTGWIYIPSADSYNFYLTSDDGAELYLDTNAGEGSDRNLKRIKMVDLNGKDSWDSHSYQEFTGVVLNLSAGLHRIVINYFEKNSIAAVKFEWQAGAGRALVPSANLYSPPYPGYNPGTIVPTRSGSGLTGDYYVWNPNWDPQADYRDRSIYKIKNYRYTRLDPEINFDWDRVTPFIHKTTGKITDPAIEDRARNSYPGGFSRLVIQAKSVYLGQNSRIFADGAGFPGAYLHTGNENGYGPGGGARNKGGGSYCGKGVWGGFIYGTGQALQPDTARPTPLGSGGGGGLFGSGGGGFISLRVDDLNMGDGSRITAKGIDLNQDPAYKSGVGSGGTVYIQAENSFYQGSGSYISVDGGKAFTEVDPRDSAGSGGAGRVAVYYPQTSPIPQNVTANGYNGAGSCSIVVAAIGAPAQATNNLSITKNTSPATVKPNEIVDIILTIYNPSDNPQVVNIKDDKFYNWNTYPAPGGNLKQLLNVRLENVTMSDSDIIMNNDNIEFKNITVPPPLPSGSPGKIRYQVRVPENL